MFILTKIKPYALYWTLSKVNDHENIQGNKQTSSLRYVYIISFYWCNISVWRCVHNSLSKAFVNCLHWFIPWEKLRIGKSNISMKKGSWQKDFAEAFLSFFPFFSLTEGFHLNYVNVLNPKHSVTFRSNRKLSPNRYK